MEILIIFALLLFALSVWLNDFYFVAPTIAAISGMIIIAVIVSGKPSAMDVYQGKTTLEITYKDGIPVDSTVIFKNKL